MHKNTYTIFFAAVITLSCSVLLALASTLLKDKQEENIAVDMRKNILASVNIVPEEGKSFTAAQVQQNYEKYIRSLIIDQKGNVVEGKTIDNLDPKTDADLLPFYYKVQEGEISAYIIPISGKGLWSTIYGYIAFEKDLNTVKGITFYKHGETPGLGGEIEQDWFRNNFIGKKISTPEDELVSITIVRGKVKDRISDENEHYHYVDGISGATLTGKGMNEFLKADLEKYKLFFEKVRQEGLEI